MRYIPLIFGIPALVITSLFFGSPAAQALPHSQLGNSNAQ